MRDDPGLCWKSLTEQLMAASNISIDKLCLKDEGREVELFRSIPAQMKEFYPSKVRQIPKNFHSSRLPETTTSLQACLEGRNTFWRDQEGRQTGKAVGQEESSDSSSGRWKFHGLSMFEFLLSTNLTEVKQGSLTLIFHSEVTRLP